MRGDKEIATGEFGLEKVSERRIIKCEERKVNFFVGKDRLKLV